LRIEVYIRLDFEESTRQFARDQGAEGQAYRLMRSLLLSSSFFSSSSFLLSSASNEVSSCHSVEALSALTHDSTSCISTRRAQGKWSGFTCPSLCAFFPHSAFSTEYLLSCSPLSSISLVLFSRFLAAADNQHNHSQSGTVIPQELILI
jgi:hypothetical protein